MNNDILYLTKTKNYAIITILNKTHIVNKPNLFEKLRGVTFDMKIEKVINEWRKGGNFGKHI